MRRRDRRGGGRAGGSGDRAGGRGGRAGEGVYPFTPPPPAATGIGSGGDLRSVAAVVVVVVAVTMVAVAIAVALERGDSEVDKRMVFSFLWGQLTVLFAIGEV